MSQYVTISQAQTQLSRLIQKVLAGEEVVIVSGKNPIARLVPIQSPKVERQIGADKGLVEIADDFAAPLMNLAIIGRLELLRTAGE